MLGGGRAGRQSTTAEFVTGKCVSSFAFYDIFHAQFAPGDKRKRSTD